MRKQLNLWVSLLSRLSTINNPYEKSIADYAKEQDVDPLVYLHDIYRGFSDVRVFMALTGYQGTAIFWKITANRANASTVPSLDRLIKLVYKSATRSFKLEKDDEQLIFRSLCKMYGDNFAENTRFYLNPYVSESFKDYVLFTEGGLKNIGRTKNWPERKADYIRRAVSQMGNSKNEILLSSNPFIQFHGIFSNEGITHCLKEEFPTLKDVPIEILEKVNMEKLAGYVDLKEGRFRDITIVSSVSKDLELSVEETKELLSKFQLPALIFESGLTVPALEFMLAVSSLIDEGHKMAGLKDVGDNND